MIPASKGAGAQSAEQSWDHGVKRPFDTNTSVYKVLIKWCKYWRR